MKTKTKMEWFKSKFPGVRYRFHKTRKNGVQKDKYFIIRYQLSGKTKSESLGWSSEGWTEQKAYEILAKIKKNIRTGEGPCSLSDLRKKAQTIKQKIEISQITVADAWEGYSKIAYGKKSWSREDTFFRLWIQPTIGNRALPEVAAIHLEKIKKHMADNKMAPRSIQYSLAIIRQLFNYARKHDLFNGENPVSKVSMPKFDNRRMRFLTHDEADALLTDLLLRSKKTHNITLLSLYTGMRAGEIFSLTWGDVDVSNGIIMLRDTKNVKTRFAFMTENVKEMFLNMKSGTANELVFPDRNGKKIIQISDAFNRAVNKLGFNEGISDRRFRVTFHTCRHTYASWLVESGVDLYSVKELLGHSDFKMTSRYAHLGQNALQNAVRLMESKKPQNNTLLKESEIINFQKRL